jgi:hypothetical protein
VLSGVLGALIILSLIASPALAQSQGSGGKSPDQWQFTLAPYLMLPWMNGTTAVRGHELEVNVGPGDIFSNLQFGVMGYFAARKGQWGFATDVVYMALGADVDKPSANVDFNQGAYAFTGSRQLTEKAALVFGARWNVLQGKLDFKGPVLKGTFKDTKQWVDPIVGLKFEQPLGGRLHFAMQADIGGFGAGSDFAWQLWPIIGVDVGKRARLGFGYRVIGMDYSTGSGNELFKYDMITQAFVMGASLRF